jgi:hypothetical protein
MRQTLFLLVLFSYATFASADPWFQQALVGMEVGPSGAQWGSDPRDVGYSSRFDGREIVEKQIAMGSEYLVLWARDHEWAHYDSKLMPKCPGLGERDPLREAVEAAKPQGLPLIAYCVVQAGGHALREHPEWGMVGVDGNPIAGRVCLNGPYRDFVHGLLDEMLAYGLDGFHVDMVDQGFGPPYGCFCTHCKAAFEQQFPDHAMPGSVSWDESWDRMLEFRYETSARFERDTMAFVKSRAPEVTVDFNYHGYPPFSFEVGQRPVQHAGIGDFVTCESGVWGFSALAAGLTSEFVRASTPGRRYQVVMQRGARFYNDQTTRPLNDLRWEMFALLMHGAQVTIVDKTPFEGQLDPVAYERMETVFREALSKREHFGQTLLYDAALYYSHRTRDWFGRAEPYRYFNSIHGAHKALTLAHLTTGVLLDESISMERLRDFPAVVLADASIISDAEVATLRAYVEQGGMLLVSGHSGTLDHYGQPTEAAALEALIGARCVQVLPDHDNYVAFASGPEPLEGLLDGVPRDWPHLVYGPAVVYEAAGATAFGELRAPVRTERQRQGQEGTTFPSPSGERIGPALLLNAVGKGQVLTFAVSPGAAAGGEYRTVEARTLLSNAVKALCPNRPVEIDAPAFVETYATRDKEGVLRVHFTSYLAPPGSTDAKRPWAIPELMVDDPLYRAQIRTAEHYRSAVAVAKSTELEAHPRKVDVTINAVHEVVVLDPR